jgi:uncharacterized protein YbjT (DUF2867 family)
MRPRFLQARSAALTVVAALLALAAGNAPAQHEVTGDLPQPTGALTVQPVVVVAGATGRTGRLVLEQLAQDKRYKVRALARDPAKAKREIGAGYEWVAADVTKPETLLAPLRGATYVVCAIGATERSGPNGPEFVDYGGVVNLTDAARQGGARQLALVSSIGVGGEGGFTRWILNLIGGDVLVWKAKGEAYLRASGLPYSIVRPGGLRDGPAGKDGLRIVQDVDAFGDITRADTAAVTIATLGNPDAVGKTFEVFADEEARPGAWRSAFAGLKADR